jgi:hypothetical protein
LAASIAYDQPSIDRSWQAYVKHLPIIAIVFLLSAALSGIGLLIYLVVYAIAVTLISGNPATADYSEMTISVLSKGAAELAHLPFAILASFVGVLVLAVPAMYYESGEVITPGEAFRVLFKRPLRYGFAGLLFVLSALAGFLLCVLPGIAVVLVAPIYVNRIFNTDEQIFVAFSRSFQGVFRSEHSWTFVGIELLVGLCVIVFSICTCFVGAFVAGPIGSFFIMNSAYRQGILR